jgi:hypothetical protein
VPRALHGRTAGGSTSEGRRTRGGDDRCTPTPHEPLLLNCGGENHPTARPTRASARATLVPPVALRAGRGLAPRSDERREDATRRGTRQGFFTTVKMYYLDDRPTSERQRADRTPRKRRAAPERAREHVFLPAAVRGRVARRKDDEGRSLHLPRDDSANECGGSGRRVSGRATSGRLDRSRTQNKHERTGSSGRSTSKSDSRRLGWKTFVWARRSDRVSWV